LTEGVGYDIIIMNYCLVVIEVSYDLQ